MELTASLLRDMIVSAANHLENKKQPVNDLNVFPVPDGDTGTNMSLTLGAARKAVLELNTDEVGAVANAAANALIRGARGNSGVILSLLFRGLAKGLKDLKTANAVQYANATTLGCEGAYKAVMKPTEGTILTVARLSAVAANNAAKQKKDLLAVFDAQLEAAKKTLAQTPDMLPVLKQAGVVDAGGQGYVVVLEGMRSVLADGKIIEATSTQDDVQATADFEGFDTEEINFAYCTEFLIDKFDVNAQADDFRAYLQTIGDCVVVVDAGDFIKTHVHTNNPGLALEAAVKLGSLTKVKIENMKEQHSALVSEAQPEETPAAPEKPYGFVAVASGDGFHTVFKDLGVDQLISGGQTMNPSTEDILKAIDRTPAETVFVLPNNKNIIMAAEQCVDLTEKKVVVLPTKTVPQGITAIFAFDPDADTDTNTEAMTAAAETVTTMQVTYAARDSVFDGLEIKKGDYLGMVNGKVLEVETTLADCIGKMADEGLTGNETYLNVFYGEGVSEEQAVEVQTLLAEHLPGADINIINGGQAVYYFVISAE